MKIFAIDDEKAALYFAEKDLKQLFPDAIIKTFLDYELFLEEVKKELPEIVFMDIEMPGISGIDLAKEVNKINPRTNIIFATAYKKYALDALEVYASGFLIKPCNQEAILNSLAHLRYPIDNSNDLVIKTFGNFDIFYKGNSIKFRSPKSKELLAYLVDRMGAKVSKKEIAGILYEDDYSRNTQRILSRNIQYLSEDLLNAGVNDFFINDDGYRVDISKAKCDLVDFLNGDKSVKYFDEYMEQYSFGELRKYSLSEIK